MPSKVKILYLHVVADAVSTDPGGEVGVAGCGDEVVALSRVELQLVGERREGSETDGEDSKILRHDVIFRYSNIRHSCYANMPITTFSHSLISLVETKNTELLLVNIVLPVYERITAVCHNPGIVSGDHATIIFFFVHVVDNMFLHGLQW